MESYLLGCDWPPWSQDQAFGFIPRGSSAHRHNHLHISTSRIHPQNTVNPSPNPFFHPSIVMHTVTLLINGEDLTSSTTFDSINPGSLNTAFKAYGADVALAKKAVDAAAAAFPAWSKTKPLVKRDLFFKAAQLLQDRADEVTRIQDQETSVDKGFAGGFQIMVSVGMLRECGARVSTIEGSIHEPDEEGIHNPYCETNGCRWQSSWIGCFLADCRGNGIGGQGTLWSRRWDGSVECSLNSWSKSRLRSNRLRKHLRVPSLPP